MITHLVAQYPSFNQVWAWFTGSDLEYIDSVPVLLFDHIWLSAAALLTACVLAIPTATVLAHFNVAPTISINVANAFRAVPAFGLLLLAFVVGGFSVWILIGVFAVIGIGPVFANTYLGIRNVDHAVIDAAKGMGLTASQQILHVEAPLALPVIMAGVRTAAVNIVATVTLAAYVDFGGLGIPIRAGLERGMQFSDTARFLAFAGASLAALLAIATEGALTVVEKMVVPQALQDRVQDNVQ